MRLRKLVLGFLLLLSCQTVFALNPAIKVAYLNHASWSEKDGMPSDVQSMAQTIDGWLWLGTADGLYRFDGSSFERVPFKFNRITHLSALANGDLLVASLHNGMIALHPDGSTTELSNDEDGFRIGSFSGMMADREGAIWAVSMRGLFRYRKGKWEHIGGSPDWAPYGEMLVDQYDRVWYVNNRGLHRYDRGTGKMIFVSDQGKGGTLIQSPDGRIWISADGTLYPVPAPMAGPPLPREADFNHQQSRPSGQFDRDGNFWAPHCERGLCRIARAGDLPEEAVNIARQATERLDQSWQLSAIPTRQVMEDREGNIWVITASGLDRFRENKLLPLQAPAPSAVTIMVKDSEGQLWVRDEESEKIWRIEKDGTAVADSRGAVAALVTDRDGALMLAGKRTIERFYKGHSSHIPLPAPGGKPSDMEVLGILDDGKVLWMASAQTGLMGWTGGEWRPRSAFNLPKRINMVAAGGTGQLWLTHSDGFLSLYDNDKLTRYDINMIGQESGIFPGTELVVAGEQGIAVLRGQKFQALEPRSAEAFRNVSGMAVTPDGDRWLNGARGVVHIRHDAWEASVRQPSIPLVYEVIDALEGYPGRAVIANRLASVFNAGNGQLWFRATGGLVRLDTSSLRPNTIKPVVRLLRVNTDKASYGAGEVLRLPPDSRNFNIQYTAPGLRKPEAIRFQYQLQGVDQQWQDAGTRRAAYYNNIEPGRYIFKARAVNEDGLVSDAVASMELEIAPTITQTWWFKLACFGAGVLILYGLYKYRLKVATDAISHQLMVRQEERERIARTLHDTFLQTVQALILQVHSVLLKLPAGSETREKLEKIMLIADETVNEGRRQVQDLRQGPDIELSLKSTGEMLSSIYPGTAFSLTVSGGPLTLEPTVQENLCAIGQEAIRNAFQHAQASAVAVSLEYAKELFLLRVTDNGRGINEVEMAHRIKDQHWGMIGLHERAASIGAHLSISAKSGKGTTLELTMGGSLAYLDKPEYQAAKARSG
jgi:ligand-binding sensor domain-containing protein/two-component sensor histidine kinase